MKYGQPWPWLKVWYKCYMDCVWSAASSQKAITAGPSAALAGSTQLASTCPSVSGSTRRLRPLKSLPARSPPGPQWASTRSARFACRGRRPWPRLFFGPFPAAHLHSRADPLPRAVGLPLGKTPVHRAPGRQIARQIPPRASVFEHVQNGVHDLRQRPFATPAHDQQRFQLLPIARG